MHRRWLPPTVGIAIGGGTDVAFETADTAVLNSRVMDVAALVTLSHAMLANINQNVAVALGPKAVFLVTTVAGMTGLWPAVLADTGGNGHRDPERTAPYRVSD